MSRNFPGTCTGTCHRLRVSATSKGVNDVRVGHYIPHLRMLLTMIAGEQVEHAFNSKRLQNWEIPAVDKSQVRLRVDLLNDVVTQKYVGMINLCLLFHGDASLPYFPLYNRPCRLKLVSALCIPALGVRDSLSTTVAILKKVSTNFVVYSFSHSLQSRAIHGGSESDEML